MLWSDPPDETPQELRDTEAMLRRAGWVLAVVALVVMIIVLGR
ncbi:morphogenic membrane protein MmpB [Streptomyces sp. NPDC048639]